MQGLKLPLWHNKMVEWGRSYKAALLPGQQLLLEVVPILYNLKDMGTTAGEHQSGNVVHNIRISPFLTEPEAIETVGHELAHLADWVVNRKHGHGKTWAHLMCQLGLRPTECHSIPIGQRKSAIDILKIVGQYNEKKK